MYIGDLVATTQTSFTPWVRRQADNAVFTYQIIGVSGTVTSNDGLLVKVFHKDVEDGGPGSDTTASFTQIGSSDFYYVVTTGLKELVRFQVACKASAGTYYRLLPPTWFDTASVL